MTLNFWEKLFRDKVDMAGLEKLVEIDNDTLIHSLRLEGVLTPGWLRKSAIPGIRYDEQRGVYLPETVEQVQELVVFANDHGRKVRAAGAEHSRNRAIFSEGSRDIRMILSNQLRRVEVTPIPGGAEANVEVGGGCYLGHNPMDPESSLANSLNAQLDASGFALPVLGGMSHQSTAGFLLTGSAGGSLRFGFADT